MQSTETTFAGMCVDQFEKVEINSEEQMKIYHLVKKQKLANGVKL